MYATNDSINARFGWQLITRLTVEAPGPGSEINTDIVDRAIAAVDGIIDGFLRQVYALPLSEIPPELASAAEDLALERIYAGKPERETPKDVKDRAKAALDWLRDIKKGLATLSVAKLPPAPGTNSETGAGFFKTSKKKSDRLFNDEKLNSFTG